MNEVILYLLLVTGGSHELSEYKSRQFDTIAECKALGRQIVAQNFSIIHYLCESPDEVQAEYFPATTKE